MSGYYTFYTWHYAPYLAEGHSLPKAMKGQGWIWCIFVNFSLWIIYIRLGILTKVECPKRKQHFYHWLVGVLHIRSANLLLLRARLLNASCPNCLCFYLNFFLTYEQKSLSVESRSIRALFCHLNIMHTSIL